MATATVFFSVTPPSGQGQPWDFSLSGIDTDNTTNNQPYSSVIGRYNGQTIFTMVDNLQSFDVYSPHYATWRSSDAVNNLQNGQYPTQGFSFDIWGCTPKPLTGTSGDLFGKFDLTWNNINGTYLLDQNKWSVLYDYTNQYPLAATKGGEVYIQINT